MLHKPRMRHRGLALGAMVLSIAMLAAACGSDKSGKSGSGSTAKESIVVGRKDFSGAQLVSDIYGGALAAKGFKVSYKDVGPTEQTYAALKKGRIAVAIKNRKTVMTVACLYNLVFI